MCASKARDRQHAAARRWGLRAAYALVQHSGYEEVMPRDWLVPWCSKGKDAAHASSLVALSELVHMVLERCAAAGTCLPACLAGAHGAGEVGGGRCCGWPARTAAVAWACVCCFWYLAACLAARLPDALLLVQWLVAGWTVLGPDACGEP
jgi:hypothetical protein